MDDTTFNVLMAYQQKDKYQIDKDLTQFFRVMGIKVI